MNGGTIVRAWDRPKGIEVYHLSQSEEEPFAAFQRMVAKNINNPHVFGLDAREIFFLDDGVVVFEGQEDVVLWPKVVKRRPSLATVNVYGWGAGGAANVGNICRVLQCLGFTKVSGIVDNNRLEDRNQLQEAFPAYSFFAIPADDIRSKRPIVARPEVRGLLDEEYEVRAEYESALEDTLLALEEYLSG